MAEINSIIICSDEVGKGEWLGPLIVAAVGASSEASSYFVTQGVMDSKLLDDTVIQKLSPIIQKDALAYHVVAIAPQRFNQLIQEVRSEGKSLNDILAWAHGKAVSKVYSDIRAKGFHGRIKVVIDEFDQLKTEQRLRRIYELRDVLIEQKPKAEKETAVAAASIVARAEREKWINEQSKRLGFELRKITAREAFSQSNVNQFAKVSFLERALAVQRPSTRAA
jgi:ribonuclease HIII